MPQIPDSFIDDLMNRIDLHDLIGRYVTLKKVGSRYMAVCPFHGDKDPSLSVTPEKGLWYCFGCQEGGNAISFIKKKENLDFPDAVRFIAQLYGIPVPEVASDPTATRRRTLYDINDRARDLFEKILRSKYGRSFRSYLIKRGFTEQTVVAYKVGASVDSWDFLAKKLHAEGFGDEELVSAGLVLAGKQGGVYDRFRRRLMIPIIDTLERTLGFGGRAMGDDSPKYMNSPESPIFQKSKILFGLNLAKDACRQSKQLIVMEGYTDVMQAHQAGVGNCCAVMGTALTREHVPLLNRFADEIILSFDGDEAGLRATLKSILELADVEFSLKVLELPEGADPADVIVSDGADSFRERLAKARPAADWMLSTVASRVRKADLKAKLREFREIAPFILAHRSAAIRDELLERAALEFNVLVPALQEVLKGVMSGARSQGMQGTPALEAFMQVSQDAEHHFFLCLLANPEYLPEARNLLEPDDCYDPLHRRLARVLFQPGFSLGTPDGLVRVPEIYDDDMLRGYVVRLTQVLLDEQDGMDQDDSRYTVDELKRCLLVLVRRRYEEESKQLRSRMAELNREGACSENDELWCKLMELMQERDELERDFREIGKRLGSGEP